MQHSNNAGCSSFNTIYYYSLQVVGRYPDSYPGEIGMWIQLPRESKAYSDIADKALPFVAKNCALIHVRTTDNFL